MRVLSPGITGWRLANEAFSDESKSYRRKQQYKSFFLPLLTPVFSEKWFNEIASREPSSIFYHRPRVYLKPFKAYMSIKWSKKRKRKVIFDTYRLLSQKGLFYKVVSSEKTTVTQFALKDGQEAVVRIGYDDRFRKEGEVVFFLESDSLHGVVSSIAFSFEEMQPDYWVCRIGCIQGHRKEDTGDYVIKNAQKQMHGMRPKSLMLDILQAFLSELGIKELYGVADCVQAQKRKHLIHISWLHNIPFSYDTFWEETGGVRGNDGWYKLPMQTVRKPIEEVKSHKRAYYKRRYALLDQIELDTKAFMALQKTHTPDSPKKQIVNQVFAISMDVLAIDK